MTRRGMLLFAALGVVWGIPYLLIKVAVEHLSPAALVFGRCGIAALLLAPLALARGEIRPALKAWKPLLAYTVVELVVPWYLLSSAEQHLPSSTTALLISAVPIAGVAIAFLMGRSEPLSRVNAVGLLIGMSGVGALVGFSLGGSDLGPAAEVGVVAVGYALGPAILARWLGDAPILGIVTLSLAISALIYLPIVALTGDWPPHGLSLSTVEAVVALAVVCSAGAFVLMAALIGEIGPVRATAITYVNPAVAIVAGAIFLQEQITAWTLLGFALVLAGSWLVTRPVIKPPLERRSKLDVEVPGPDS